MQASVDQIAERIYRISTYVPEIGPTGFSFNQFLVDAEEPLLYHTGMRRLFPIVSEAIARVLPVREAALNRVRTRRGRRVRRDERVPRRGSACTNRARGTRLHADAQRSGGPSATTAAGWRGHRPRRRRSCPPGRRGSDAARATQLGVARVLRAADAALFCGDLLTQLGKGPAIVADDLIDAAIAAEDLFHQTSLGPLVPATYRKLADLDPTRLAIMHGSSY
jgi:hypothetical protein